jgi:hypothetical protein
MNDDSGGGDASLLRWGFQFVYMHAFWYKSGLLLSFVAEDK